MNTTIINTITDAIGKHLNVTLWTKKGVRLYVNGYGYNTKKCKQSIYIDLENFRVVCFTDCPSQPSAWCQSQSAEVVRALEKFARLARLIATCSAEKKQEVAPEISDELYAEINEKINVIADNENGYHGCGEYALAVSRKNILGTFYAYKFGDRYTFENVSAAMKRLFGADVDVVRATGSGTAFFLADRNDKKLFTEVKEYFVPAPNGDGSHGDKHLNLEIIAVS